LIRRATIEDIRPIFDMIAAYHDEAVKHHGLPLDFDPDSVVAQLGTWLWRTEYQINLVADGGVMLGEVQTTWFGNNLFGKPHAIYIYPKHRNGLLARAFIRRFDREAKALGALGVIWDNWAGISDRNMLGSLMEKFGYFENGQVFAKVFHGD
jgi:hypothetical protein